MAQAGEVAARLGAFEVQTELVPIETSGDRGAPVSRSPSGLKGLFVAEIEQALANGLVDLAVHSAKDLPAEETPGITLGAVPRRERPFDVLVRRELELAEGATVGTSSLRRRAQLHRARPHLTVVDIRGNVDTRLAKLEAGEVDALVLASAGLLRLGMTPPHQVELYADEMVPAPGQGTLAIQTRADDGGTLKALRVLEDPDSRTVLEAERALMARLGGGCALPLGAFATIQRGNVHLIGLVATPDGRKVVRSEAGGRTPDEAAALVAEHLLGEGAGEILTAVRSS
jgi:hydroxymethylbilane synthase